MQRSRLENLWRMLYTGFHGLSWWEFRGPTGSSNVYAHEVSDRNEESVRNLEASDSGKEFVYTLSVS